MMRAMVYREYGAPQVLHMEKVEKPIPGENDLLIKVGAAGLNAYDWRHLRADPFLIRLMVGGLFRPRHPILGADMAGTVETVGKLVSRFKPGDKVYGEAGYGGFAEFACGNADRYVSKPANLSFLEAAAVPMAALTALQGLRDKGGIRAGQKVLVNGAAGGVGTFAVQIARSFGAVVDGVCSAKNLERVSSLGASHVIDYAAEDFSRNGRKYDLIFDVAANRSIQDYRRSLSPEGICVVAGFSTISRMIRVMLGGGKQVVMVSAEPNTGDLDFLNQLLMTGKIRPIVDRSYPLAELPEAVRYLETGHPAGKVVIDLGNGDTK